MSEELSQIGANEHGRVIGSYEFYNIGDTTLNQLKRAHAVPDKDYAELGPRKPDALLVDRRNQRDIRVVLVVERKDTGRFASEADRRTSVEQCNDLAQVLDAEVGVATDGHSFIWFNPRHPDPQNEYPDRTTTITRSYSIIRNETGEPFIKEFSVDQEQDEPDMTKLSPRTRKSIETMELVRRSMSRTNSQIVKESTVDPTSLATQIWQDVWSVTGATPEKCLYTFVELFIFKYLSDLGVLDEDDKGNKIGFEHIYSLGSSKAFKNYTDIVRPYLRIMFPPSVDDHTTIINGTVLSEDVPEHREVFYKILKRFGKFGPLRNIDPSFKSKVFEEFMKETISKKNWGQFFTPRKIIDAMIEISDIDKLAEGSEVCDPACGVGGFILEPLKVKNDGVNFYYRIQGNNIVPRYRFVGFDKGFQNDEQLVVILAKANMLIFLTDLIRAHPTMVQAFSQLFNSTFQLLSKTILGTLARIEKDKYDLVLTNPPYVTSGSSNYKEAIRRDDALRQFYTINATGVEGLFLEWIVRSVKPGRKAFVIIPDGILNRSTDEKLRGFIKEECIIDGIVSLPVNAFYRNPKKTYILAITKKPERSDIQREEHPQTEPVFTYLVSTIGETLDVKRFPIDDNNLSEMVSLFNQFKGAKTAFRPESKRCKIQAIERFDPHEPWSVDRWWTREEKVELGIEEQDTVMTLDEFKQKVADTEREIRELNHKLRALE